MPMHLKITYSTSIQPCQLQIVCRTELSTTEAKQLLYNLFPLGLSFMQFYVSSSGMRVAAVMFPPGASCLSVFMYHLGM